MTDFEFKEKYNIDDLLQIMTILRSPGGCPWDREQTHMSIKKDFIEETYEAIEAINKDDKDLLREELGDVLLQVVFHCEIEREKSVFDFSDVTDELCKKLFEEVERFDELSVVGFAAFRRNGHMDIADDADFEIGLPFGHSRAQKACCRSRNHRPEKTSAGHLIFLHFIPP